MFKKYRWNIVLMLFLGNALNYVDRTAMSVALPILNKRFELTPFESGLILSSFFVGYALFNFVGGYLSDKVGPKKVMGSAMVVWSLFCGLTAGAYNFVSLLIVRLFFGFGEGPITATTNKTMNNWIPVKERATAVGICNGGAPVGGALSAPIVAFASLAWGWEATFIILGVIGFIWALVWWKVSADKPEDHPMVSKEEVAEINAGRIEIASTEPTASAQVKVSLLSIIKQKRIFALLLGMFGYNYTLFFFLTWFPTYLVDARHLSIKEMGFAAMIPWIAGAIGQLLGSIIIDYIYRKTGKLLFSRKVVLVTCLMLAALCVGLTGFVNDVVSAVSLMTVGICFLYLQATTYWAIIQDIVPRDRVGGTSGFIHAMANVSGILGPSITGWLVQTTGQYTSAFVLAASLAMIGALAVAFFVNGPKVPKNQEVIV
ncbi:MULTISPECIES: MFS transporter [Pelosinus]|uniref:Major facilitator superfamily MFS_1 n=1 Tax=Pelosinus fermentans B4 TaxID=1149862 RepID=I9LHQ5_9FIRM|nr:MULTISPECIES: MFS transporter [Pelosinus]MDF2571418.1 hexuronate transporter [Sporomusa sp.]EIW20054.1 major facilitator superfamily MFS_1 [Pelosinus fermentans B4]EIW26091.1 major facilitator superfamily MFS_1 [Pelosinus fermentans A11]OAM93140.1 major facilitator superfamily MFS_1 [Pelosinus fermentans DSM 17108]SDQ68300.1 MFS transporter, ACS family, hexuronate transporter [Pelosinus fermentans]